MSNMNGHDINAPICDPRVIQQAQHLLELAQQGRIIGFAATAIGTDGAVHHQHAIPQQASALQLVIGGMAVLIGDLTNAVQSMRQAAPVSPIIKPHSLTRHG